MSHTIDEAVRDYLVLRTEISAVNAQAKERVAQLKTAQDSITRFLDAQRVQLGVESFRTAEGTAFRQKWERVSVEDWTAFLAWLLATGNTQMLTKAVSKEAVLEFMNDTKTVPPGLKYEHGHSIHVRKGSK